MSTTKGRTFTGCWACRFKKRRCDERKPKCSLCQKHGDRCCYDVQLVWLEDNLYKCAHGRFSSQAQLAGSHVRRKLSKQDLRVLFRETISPESELGEDLKDTGSFTVSVRRLKIYDNAVESVYGCGKRRNYSQRHVNWVLDQLLHDLESKGSKRRMHKQGPFSLFDGKRSVIPPSAAHTCVSHWVDQEVETLLWLQGQDPVLSHGQFREWYLDYMRRKVPIEFCHAMQKSDPLETVKEQFPQWVPFALTIFVAVHGYTHALASELADWLFAQQDLERWMLPTVSPLVVNCQSYQVLRHCSKLLSNCSHIPEAYLLEARVVGKLVDQWRDKIIEQLCVCQDTARSFPQLKFWQSQLDRFQSIPI